MKLKTYYLKLFFTLIGLSMMTTEAAPLFDINKKQDKINFVSIAAPTCDNESQYFPALPSNPKADLYYRAANKILGQRDTRYYKHMYILGQKAADMGHWKAKLLMADRYLQKSRNYYSEFQPEKARAYIDELMSQNVPEAFYDMSQNRNGGYSGFKTSPSPASFYLYRAAQLGHPKALVAVSNIFLTVKRYKEARALLECGLKQGAGGAAANSLSVSEFVNARTHEDWVLGFKYLYAGAKAGDEASMGEFQVREAMYQKKNPRHYLSPEFIRRADALAFAMDPQFHHDDPYRKSKGRPYRVKGNAFLKFPNLEKIIPLPPAKLPAWNGDITVGMSAADARDYREDFDYDKLVKEIQNTNVSLKGCDQQCPETGYWQPKIKSSQLAGLYVNRLSTHWVKKGQQFPLRHINPTIKDQIEWEWDAEANEAHQAKLAEAQNITCLSDTECVLTGVYRPSLPYDHPRASLVNNHSGVFVIAGTRLPSFGLTDPRDEMQIVWRWVSEG